MKLWEIADIRTGKRISLHWTLEGALNAPAPWDSAVRLRTLPKWTRPFHRLIVW